MMEKKVHLEYLRIIACALVIFNHLKGYSLFGISGGIKQIVYMTITMVTRINVPIFFMISGSLLLRKEEDYKTVFKKRISRIVAVIVLAEAGLFALSIIKSLMKGIPIEKPIENFVFGVLKGSISGAGPYWYLYAYLGFLLTLPFAQRIAKGMNKQDFAVLLGFHALFSSVIPLINIALSRMNMSSIVFSTDFNVPFISIKAFFYTLIGYYLDNKVDVLKLKKKHLFGLVLLGCVGIFASCRCTFYEASLTNAYSQNYVQLFDYLTAIVVFILVKYLVVSKDEAKKLPLRKFAVTLGSLTFGIYLLDPFFKMTFSGKYDALVEPYLPTIIVSFGYVVLSMTLGGVITFFLKKIPFVRKFI